MARSIDGRAVVLARLKHPQPDAGRDTTLTFSLQVVKDPRVLERALAELLHLLLELLNRPLVNAGALGDESSRRLRLDRVDVADGNDVDVTFSKGIDL